MSDCMMNNLIFVFCWAYLSLGTYSHFAADFNILGPVVQSVVSLTSSLVVKMLTVLVSTISNSKVFLLEKCE